MHILILPSWYPKNADDIGGVFFREQAQALHNAGYQVGVIAYEMLNIRNIRRFIFSRQGQQFKNDNGVLTYRLTAKNYFPKVYNLSLKLLVSKTLQLFEYYVSQHGLPDIVHVHSMLNAGFIALAIKKKYGVPYVVTEHSSGFVRGKVSARQIVLAKRIAGEAELLIAVSSSFAIALERLLGENMPWQVIPNIITEHFFRTTLIDQKNISFISVCFLNRNKRLDILLQAFSLVHHDRPEVVLQIGGDGPEMQKLKQQASDLGLASAVEFLGPLSREEVNLHIARSSCLISCSEYETFGVVVAEALALGKPVIATKSGGPQDIIECGDGILVPINDVNALSAAMFNIMSNYKDYDSRKIRQRCKARFSAQVVTGLIIDGYKKALDEYEI